MSSIFNKKTEAARTVATIAGSSDDETAEDLVGLDHKQLERLAERLGIHIGGTVDDLREAIRSIVEQPGAPVTGSRLVH